MSSSGLSLCKQPVSQKLFMNLPPPPRPTLMHSTFAALFDLLSIYFIHFKSETLSVNPAAPTGIFLQVAGDLLLLFP